MEIGPAARKTNAQHELYQSNHQQARQAPPGSHQADADHPGGRQGHSKITNQNARRSKFRPGGGRSNSRKAEGKRKMKDRLLAESSNLILRLNIKRHNQAYKLGYEHPLIKKIDRVLKRAKQQNVRRNEAVYGNAISPKN